MYGMIQQIAAWYPEDVRDEYIAAASNFRVPYWDWAVAPPAGESVLPSSTSSSPTISVDGPSGVQLIANPLFTYQFKPLNSTDLPDYPVSACTAHHR